MNKSLRDKANIIKDSEHRDRCKTMLHVQTRGSHENGSRIGPYRWDHKPSMLCWWNRSNAGTSQEWIRVYMLYISYRLTTVLNAPGISGWCLNRLLLFKQAPVGSLHQNCLKSSLPRTSSHPKVVRLSCDNKGHRPQDCVVVGCETN